MTSRWLLAAALFMTINALHGQRVYEKVALADVDDTLHFDSNEVGVTSTNLEIKATGSRGNTGDLNFAPNLIFAPDSSKAFVSISGSDKVMVFNPVSGEIIDFITVGDNPSQLFLAPDGKTLATVCLLLKRNIPQPGGNFEGERVARIALIDMETFEVRAIDLSEVLVSFSNGIVFSPDGKIGYLPSAGTDELLRFSLETLEEIGPRVKFTPGIRPMWIAASPDGSFLAVSLVGSARLDRIQNPDRIAFVDPQSFTITKTLAPETGGTTGEPLHDFSASTMLVFSPDGRYLGITDQLISSASQLPELATDRFWVLDLETQQFTRYLAGGVATGVYWTPTGEFLVISSLQLDFINPETGDTRRFTPLRSQFRPRTKPAFTADGKWLYIATPISDEIVVFNLETREVPRYLQIGGQIERENGAKLSSAPLEIGFTPDGQTLVVADFNADVLEFVKSTTQFSIQRVLSDATWFTGVAITNPEQDDASVIITGFNNSGGEIQDDPATEDVVEFVNPRELTIDAGTQFAETADEVLQSSESGAVTGWFDVDSDVTGLKSFFLNGDYSLKRLDGAVAVSGTSQKFIVPEVQVLDGRRTELAILNPNRQVTNVTISMVGPDGVEIAATSRQMASRTVFATLLRDPDPDDTVADGLFPESDFEDFVDGYLSITSPTGVVAYERILDDERMAAINGEPVSDRDPQPTRFYVPQVALFQGTETMLKLVNSNPKAPEDDGEGDPELPTPEQQRVQVTLTLKGNDGQDLAPVVAVTLEGGESLRQSIAEIFGLTDQGSVQSGWLLVEADKPGLAGSAELQVFDGKAMSSVSLQSNPSDRLIFSHVADGLGLSTGLSLINPGAGSASVTIDVVRKDGTLNGSVNLAVPAGGREVGLLSDLLPGLDEQIGGFVRVTSDVPLVGLELFYADNLEYMAAVAAQ